MSLFSARRAFALLSVTAAAPLIGGCVASMALSAAGLAAQAAQGRPQSNAALRPQARAECSARAAQYGAVNIIDVQQQRTDLIIVWGTVDDSRKKQSFQCNFTSKITSFKLRPIVRRN